MECRWFLKTYLKVLGLKWLLLDKYLTSSKETVDFTLAFGRISHLQLMLGTKYVYSVLLISLCITKEACPVPIFQRGGVLILWHDVSRLF